MYIHRDITNRLISSQSYIQILLGPRQCGKSTLFNVLATSNLNRKSTEVVFHDLQLRQLVNEDPALFLQQFLPPLILKEAQYVPNLFPELKKRVDEIKRRNLFEKGQKSQREVLFRLTGSNQILMDKNIKESLAGRASYFQLNTLSVYEILSALPACSLTEIIFKGGWPELYDDTPLSPVNYLNDYIRSYLEKDIMVSAGVQKMSAFHTVLRLCAARTGQEADYTTIQKDSGVSAVTVKEWISILERADLVYFLKPYFNNLNKRLIKRPKIYFLDTGLAVRLQGWSDQFPLMTSPQIGALFETLVLAEVVKFIRNMDKDWELFFWRTKDGQEVDLLIKTARGEIHAFEVKYAIQGIKSTVSYPPAFQKQFSPKIPLVVVVAGGSKLQLSEHCLVVPIADLFDYLCEIE